MTQEASNQLIDKIKVILKGIDQTEIESADGWWETSTGAKLGAEALKQILELLAQTQEPVAWPCLIDSADFSKNTITLVMQCDDYKVSAGTHWLSTAPPQENT